MCSCVCMCNWRVLRCVVCLIVCVMCVARGVKKGPKISRRSRLETHSYLQRATCLSRHSSHVFCRILRVILATLLPLPSPPPLTGCRHCRCIIQISICSRTELKGATTAPTYTMIFNDTKQAATTALELPSQKQTRYNKGEE